jgi:branched-subunit amino acid transport protein
MSAETDAWTLITIALLTANTVVTRCFFFISSKRWSLPGWARRSLNYAPIAALAAVIVPEIVMTQGQLINTWQDARLFGVAAGCAWFYWRGSLLGTLVCGMAAYLPLRLGLGW